MRDGRRLATPFWLRRLLIRTAGFAWARGDAWRAGRGDRRRPRDLISQEQDVTGNGGVLKTILRAGSGDAPPADVPVRVELKYEGRLQSGEVVDSSPAGASARFPLGRGHVIRGLDAAVQAMRARRAPHPGGLRLRRRRAAACRAAARHPRPRALLGFEAIDACEAETVEAGAAGELPALPYGSGGAAAAERRVRRLSWSVELPSRSTSSARSS
ncbi:unnamed protein product [Prorocentrum cordatum]|uniref:peptidylprolyl isomerase n=1 Tax=Prorocentrum cordatum TaxID=2364126 RepID=A0ABN9TW42_9DINO|nr:unnamed protein product [Polarella glacialis]